MKFHLTKVSLAILSTAFLLGCQDQGSGVVGPNDLGPQFAKPGACPGHPSCKDDPGGGSLNALVTVTVASSILNGSEGKRDANLVNGGSSIHGVTLTVTDNDCSISGSILGKFGFLDAEGTAGYTFPVPVGSPRWNIRFSGGVVTGDPWPPNAIDQSSTWTYTDWELTQQSPKGKKKKSAGCPTSGQESITITVVNTG